MTLILTTCENTPKVLFSPAVNIDPICSAFCPIAGHESRDSRVVLPSFGVTNFPIICPKLSSTLKNSKRKMQPSLKSTSTQKFFHAYNQSTAGL